MTITESQIDDVAEEMKKVIEMNHKLLEFVKKMACVESEIYPVHFSIDVEKLLKEIGEL